MKNSNTKMSKEMFPSLKKLWANCKIFWIKLIKTQLNPKLFMIKNKIIKNHTKQLKRNPMLIRILPPIVNTLNCSKWTVNMEIFIVFNSMTNSICIPSISSKNKMVILTNYVKDTLKFLHTKFNKNVKIWKKFLMSKIRLIIVLNTK